MTDTVKGMARAFVYAKGGQPDFKDTWQKITEWEREAEAMRAALLWLADNVSDKMAHHAASQYFDKPLNEANPPRVLVEFGGVISAAIRAAAGSNDGR
jgi:hypothetical protein